MENEKIEYEAPEMTAFDAWNIALGAGPGSDGSTPLCVFAVQDGN